MKNRLKSFITENEMSNALEEFFASSIRFYQLKNFREILGPCGQPDHVLVSVSRSEIISLVAFELKLKDWKKGLTQAFRYRAYANTSVLVLDEANIEIALPHIDEFKRSNVGLASFSFDGRFQVWHEPKPDVPFSPQMAIQFADKTLLAACSSESKLGKPSRFARSTLGALRIGLLANWI